MKFKDVLNESTFKTVKVTYSNGKDIVTSVNGQLSDDEIKKYFMIGKEVNIGNGEKDKMVKVKSVEIIAED